MRLILGLIAMAVLAGSSAQTASGAEASAPASDQDVTLAVSGAADFARSNGVRTLFYFELDETGGQVGFGIIMQPAGSTMLAMYNGDQLATLGKALLDEAKASGWRRITIVVDKDIVTVERGPSPGWIGDFDERLRAQANQAFPGHTAYPHSAQPE